MEFTINNKAVLDQLPALIPNGVGISSSSQPFIEANTLQMSVAEMADKHIIPVWATSNEPLISHSEFISATWEMTHKLFGHEQILKPNVRVSHPIKGRIPEAKNKPASQLEPWESTIYYERMMFVIEVPTIRENVNGNLLSLTIGGVKSYNLDNLYGKRSHGDQHFQLFIGFQNKVCCNMCVWTDGYKLEAGVKSIGQLKHAIEHLLVNYNEEQHLKAMKSLGDEELTEREFAQVVGRARMYKHLPETGKNGILPLLLGDQQMSAVVNNYYQDPDFGNGTGGSINLWDFYNLLTGANKSTYIDNFLERGINALDFAHAIAQHKARIKPTWYLG